MNIRLLTWMTGVLALTTAAAAAAERPTRQITLMEAAQLALQQNLQIKIQRIDPEIARLTLRSAYGVYDPIFYADTRRENLTDSGGYDPADFSKDAIYTAESHTTKMGITGLAPSGMNYFFGGDYANSFGERNFVYFDSYNINADFNISQPLLRDFWIDQGRMTIQISRKHIKVTELALKYAIMEVLSQLHQGYYELMYARENVGIYQNLRQTRENFLKAIQRQVQGGLLTVADESLAESQLSATRADLEEARQAVDLAENNLRLLMGESFSQSLTNALKPMESLMVIAQMNDFSQSCRQALAQRPDLDWLRTEAEKTDVDLKFRYNQLFPSLNIVAGWRRSGAHTLQDFWAPPKASSGPAFAQLRRGDSPSDMIGLVLTVPLSRTAERANYRLSKERKEQTQLMVRQKEEFVMREVADAVAMMQAGLRRVDANRETVRHAQAVLTAEEKKLAGGKSTVLFVLQFQTDLVLARSAELRAKADYNQACALLRFAEGAIIEASNLKLEIKP